MSLLFFRFIMYYILDRFYINLINVNKRYNKQKSNFVAQTFALYAQTFSEKAFPFYVFISACKTQKTSLRHCKRGFLVIISNKLFSILQGYCIQFHLLNHRQKTVSTRRRQMLFQAYLINEVQICIRYFLRCVT